MHGLTQAGILANELLVKLQAIYSFSKQNTPQDYGATKSAQSNIPIPGLRKQTRKTQNT